MSETDTADAIDRWLPRFVAAGVEYSDVRRVAARIASWADWHDGWVVAADEHATIAAEAEGSGRDRTAGEAFVRAAVLRHFGKFLWLEDAGRQRASTERSVAEHGRGMALLDPTFERLEVAFAADRLVGNLRRPGGVIAPPLVILVPGMDSTKEEFGTWEDVFLARGLATLSVDGPGQGEGGFVNRLRPDYEAPVAALIDALGGRRDIDVRRLGITGMGMGGFFASRAAAFEPRIVAVGVVGGPYAFERMPPLVRAKFMYSAGIADVDRARAHAAAFTLEGVSPRIEQPYLVVHGGRDAVMTPEVAERATRAAPRGEFVLYPEGNTVCQSVSHLVRPRIADWFVDRLGSTD